MVAEKVYEAVAELLTGHQARLRKPCPPLSPDTVPIGGIPGFDSNSGHSLTCPIAVKLRVQIPVDVNVFLNPEGTRALPLRDVVGRVMECAQELSL